MKIDLFKNNSERKLNKIRLKYIKQQSFDTTHGYSIIKDSKNLLKQEFIMELANEYDKYGYMSQKLGEELDNLFSDDNYVIGIHRTGYTPISNGVLNDIFNHGLINNGHVFTGANTGQCDIEKTVTLFNDFTILCGQLKAAHGYKGSEGCIVVRIPKQCLYETNRKPMPMYYKHDDVIKLLPRFIYGYIPVDNEGKLGEMHHNSNYNEIPIENENLLYDDKVVYRCKRNNQKINIQFTSNLEKYEIIKNAFIQTYNKYGQYQAKQALLKLINENEYRFFTGDLNKLNLQSHVIYSDVLKILYMGLVDKIQKDASVDTIIKTFEMQCLKQNITLKKL